MVHYFQDEVIKYPAFILEHSFLLSLSNYYFCGGGGRWGGIQLVHHGAQSVGVGLEAIVTLSNFQGHCSLRMTNNTSWSPGPMSNGCFLV